MVVVVVVVEGGGGAKLISSPLRCVRDALSWSERSGNGPGPRTLTRTEAAGRLSERVGPVDWTEGYRGGTGALPAPPDEAHPPGRTRAPPSGHRSSAPHSGLKIDGNVV